MRKTAVILLFSIISILSAKPLEKVSLQLAWKYQFEFAGFIAAKEKGFYKEAGLDVDLVEYSSSDIVDDVLDQRYTYGLINAPLAIKEKKIQPIVILASYLQMSPLAFVTQPNIKLPKDFIGKTILGTPDELENSSLALFLEHFYINLNNTIFKNHTFDIQDFIDGKIDITTVFASNELYELQQQDVDFNIFHPSDFGFMSTAVNLFTSQEEIANHPERTKAFIDASNRGWQYALAHKDELIDIIYQNYSQAKSKEALAFEAQEIEKLMLRDFYEIGQISKEISYRLLHQLQRSYKLDHDIDLKHYFVDDFNLAANPEQPTSFFTPEELNYLSNKKRINVCVDPDWLPFESLKNGKHIGIAADVFSRFKEQVSIPFNIIQTETWSESLEAAKDRQCDLLSLASQTPDRTEYMDFTSPYIDLPIVIATQKNRPFLAGIEDVLDKKIAIVKGYAIADILKNKFPTLQIVEVASSSEGLRMVESGSVYGYIDNLMVIAHSIQKEFTDQLVISGRLDETVELAIGTRNDEPRLNTIFQKLVNNVSQEEMQVIYNRWVNVNENIGISTKVIWYILLTFTVIALFVSYHYYQLKRYNNLLKQSSYKDNLTGLYNRIKLDAELKKYYTLTQRYNLKTCLIMMDIDYFKSINDNYGHLSGDRVLKEIGAILTSHSRESDAVGRWGGEEFMIILPMTTYDEAVTIAERYRTLIHKHDFSGLPNITASFGVQCMSTAKSIEMLVDEADRALYEAKSTGRNRVVTFGQLQEVD